MKIYLCCFALFFGLALASQRSTTSGAEIHVFCKNGILLAPSEAFQIMFNLSDPADILGLTAEPASGDFALKYFNNCLQLMKSELGTHRNVCPVHEIYKSWMMALQQANIEPSTQEVENMILLWLELVDLALGALRMKEGNQCTIVVP